MNKKIIFFSFLVILLIFIVNAVEDNVFEHVVSCGGEKGDEFYKEGLFGSRTVDDSCIMDSVALLDFQNVGSGEAILNLDTEFAEGGYNFNVNIYSLSLKPVSWKKYGVVSKKLISTKSTSNLRRISIDLSEHTVNGNLYIAVEPIAAIGNVKRIISADLSVGETGPLPAVEEEICPLPGDVDSDGALDCDDYNLLKNSVDRGIAIECGDFDESIEIDHEDVQILYNFLLQNDLDCAIEESVCTDSDGGIDYYHRGFANDNVEIDGGEIFEDVCTVPSIEGYEGPADYVHEYYCEDGHVRGHQFHCPHGCQDGACVEEPKGPTKPSYIVLDENGYVYGANAGTVLQKPLNFNFNGARDIEIKSVSSNGEVESYYMMDGFGRIVIITDEGQDEIENFNWDSPEIARDIEIDPITNGIYLLDYYGVVHTVNGADTSNLLKEGDDPLPYFNFDIARDMEITKSGRGAYILDGYGGVHARGDAPLISGCPYWPGIRLWPGYDTAKDLEIAYDENDEVIGLYILDGHGAIHKCGSPELVDFNANNQLYNVEDNGLAKDIELKDSNKILFNLVKDGSVGVNDKDLQNIRMVSGITNAVDLEVVDVEIEEEIIIEEGVCPMNDLSCYHMDYGGLDNVNNEECPSNEEKGSDIACCSEPDMCVYEGECYEKGSVTDIIVNNGWPGIYTWEEKVRSVCGASSSNPYVVFNTDKWVDCSHDYADCPEPSCWQKWDIISFHHFKTSEDIYENPKINPCDNGVDCIGQEHGCCSDPDQCVFGGDCYNVGQTADFDGNDKMNAVCSAFHPEEDKLGSKVGYSRWRDCDAGEIICGKCGYNYVGLSDGETSPFGEYDDLDDISCCGDDEGEYYWLVDYKCHSLEEPQDVGPPEILEFSIRPFYPEQEKNTFPHGCLFLVNSKVLDDRGINPGDVNLISLSDNIQLPLLPDRNDLSGKCAEENSYCNILDSEDLGEGDASLFIKAEDVVGNIIDNQDEALSINIYQSDSLPDLDVTYIERLPKYDYDAEKGWPDEGETVTFTAHVKNYGEVTIDSFDYEWYLDGEKVSESIYQEIRPGSEVTIGFEWSWKKADHHIKFVADPNNQIEEVSEQNNEVEDRTNALAVGFWVEQSLYNWFAEHQIELGLGSNSFEDWAQRHMRVWNGLFEQSVYGLTPNGIIDRVRLDKVVVVDDGSLPLRGSGSPGNRPDTNDKTSDMVWGFPTGGEYNGWWGDQNGPRLSIDTNNPFYLDYGYIHELSHARYIIDTYRFNVVKDEVKVRDDEGNLIAGTDKLHLLQYGIVYLQSQAGHLMGGQAKFGEKGRYYYSEHSAYAWNRIAGRRSVNGNVNFPANGGEYVDEIAQNNKILVLANNGASLNNAQVKIYQSDFSDDSQLYKVIDNILDFEGNTDNQGIFEIGAYPFAGMQEKFEDEKSWRGWRKRGIILVEIRYNGQTDYKFLDLAQFNLAYWRSGNADEVTIELQTDLNV